MSEQGDLDQTAPGARVRRSGFRQRKSWWAFAVAALIAVPLAVAGFFAGALSGADRQIENIPALVVNNDSMITTILPDGTEQPIFAGRQLVTELTGGDATGFDWTVSNQEDADRALAGGDAYAVLTIPKDFSTSINSISSPSPKQAQLAIRTDGSHGYLAGSVAQSVGQAMAQTFGRAITSQYLASFYGGLAGMGDSLATASNGAKELSSGAGALSSGLTSLATGAHSASSGAESLADGVAGYTRGVDELSDGLDQLNSGASDLSSLAAGTTQYTDAVGKVDDGFESLKQSLLQNPTNEPYRQALETFGQNLGQLADQGVSLSSSTRTAVAGLQSGISSAAGGAAKLADGSAGLRSGASALADGAGKLATGATKSADGASDLAAGAKKLSDGLASGADQVAALGGADSAKTADVVAEPVTVKVDTDNAISSIGAVIGMVFVPIGLWVGALAIMVALRPLTRVALASTAPTRRLVARSLGRAVAIAAAQALALTALLHVGLGVEWSLVPQTLPFALLVAAAFTAFHYLLQTAFGRAGIVVSVVLLALQVTSMAGLYPVQLLAKPFETVSPWFPLSYGVQGMQTIVSGAGGMPVAQAALVLALFGLASVALALWLVARKRAAAAISLTPHPVV